MVLPEVVKENDELNSVGVEAQNISLNWVI